MVAAGQQPAPSAVLDIEGIAAGAPVEPVPPGAPPRPRVRDTVFSRPRYGAAIGGFVFWVLSLWPTLLPRSVVVQAAVSAVCAGIGWLLGSLLHSLVGFGLRRLGRVPGEHAAAVAWRVLLVAMAVVAVPMLLLWRSWQNRQRELIGLGDLSWFDVVLLVPATLAVLALLVLIGRLLFSAGRGIDRFISRFIPPGWARALTALVIVVIVVGAVNGTQRRFLDWSDQQFGAVNETTSEGIEAPTLATVSGSPASLASWDSLGRQGRSFVAEATRVEDLAAFADADADVTEPIRVYVGLDSAVSARGRLDMVIDELERTGAFERDVLVVATATGTGWINPVAARAIEYLYGGDTAIVSGQYSFLPSWIAFLVDPGRAAVTGDALFDAVHTRWAELPDGDRPLLLVFGESLGSSGTEAAFLGPDLDETMKALAEQVDGALLVGPTASNPVFGHQLQEGRDPGSPTWRPELSSDPYLRVANTAAEIDSGDPSWVFPRTLYLHHPTDAVGTWNPDHLWRPPGWTEHPTGHGVPEQVRWFPIVTLVQETADLAAGFGVKPGFGHDYTDAFVQAWAAVAPPEGWTEADKDRLVAHLAALDEPEGDEPSPAALGTPQG